MRLHNWRRHLLGNYSSLKLAMFKNRRDFSKHVRVGSFKGEGEEARTNYHFVRKTVFNSSKPTVVFTAGLEGTGHHFLRTALNRDVCGDGRRRRRERSLCYYEAPTLADISVCGLQGHILHDQRKLHRLRSAVDRYQGELLFLNIAGKGNQPFSSNTAPNKTIH